jgi:hypothetical protein
MGELQMLCASLPWCLGAGSSAARAASPAKAEPPPKFWRITVSCKEDLQVVEHKLRRLYGTIDGQGCQALLTTEYQQWKNTVLRHFLNHSGDAAGARLLDASLADNVPRCRFPSQFPEDHHDAAACRRPLVPAIEAFLPNYHLLYVQGSVDINPHEPVVRVDARTKRGRELEDHEL